MSELSIEIQLLHHTQRETYQHKMGQLSWTLGQVCASLDSNMKIYTHTHRHTGTAAHRHTTETEAY